MIALSGNRTRDPINQAAAALYLRLHGRREQLKFLSDEAFIASLYR